jgi:O-antigen biosynthesis protein WbqP
VKRAFDIAAALAGLLLLWPVMLVVALLIRRETPGGAILAQERVGHDERPFTCYKFRTMTSDAPFGGSHEVGQAWITPLGRRLRRFKIDELPQLYNVMRGDMSLVGPRPCLPSQSEVITERRRLGVFAVRPGITGRAQVDGIDMSTPRALAEADRAYVDTQSLAGDLRIILQTVLGKGSGDPAARR